MMNNVIKPLICSMVVKLSSEAHFFYIDCLCEVKKCLN